MTIKLIGWDNAQIPSFVSRACKAASLPVEIVDDSAGSFSRDDDAHTVVFYRSPSEVVRESIAGGLPPTAATAIWSASTTRLLAWSRKCRARVSLVSPHPAGGDPAAVLARLGERLRFELADPSPAETAEKTAAASDEADLFDVMAQAALAAPAAIALLEELEGASLPVNEPKPFSPASLDRAFRFLFATLRNITQLQAESATLEAERDGVAARFAECSAELEAARAKEAASAQTAALLKTRIGTLEAERDGVAARLAERSAELEAASAQMATLLKAQIGTLQGELERQLESDGAHLAEAQKALAALHESERALSAERDVLAADNARLESEIERFGLQIERRAAETKEMEALSKTQIAFLQVELERQRVEREGGLQAEAALKEARLRDRLDQLQRDLDARESDCERLKRKVEELDMGRKAALSGLASASVRQKLLETNLLLASSRLLAHDMAMASAQRCPSETRRPLEVVGLTIEAAEENDAAEGPTAAAPSDWPAGGRF